MITSTFKTGLTPALIDQISSICFGSETENRTGRSCFPKTNEMSVVGRIRRLKGNTPVWATQALAEFMGTFILLVFGNASWAQYILSRGKLGTILSVNFSWAMAVTFGIYWAGSISGGHINPAVTIAFAADGRLPLWKVPIYILSQLLAGITSAAFVYAIYHDAIDAYDGGTRQILGINGTAGIFATYPNPATSNMTGFWDSFFSTVLFIALIFAVVDEQNEMRPPKGLAPLIIGFIVFLAGMTFRFNAGCAINPAGDLGPRIFTAIAGWGAEVFTIRNHWAWIPPIAGSLGGVVGAYLYVLTVTIHRQEPTIAENPEQRKIDLEVSSSINQS